MKETNEKQIIGRKDIVDLPELELFEIDAKIDTGAYTSAIHCHHIRIEKKEGQEVLHFELLDPEHPDYNDKAFAFKEFKTRNIKSSFGSVEERYSIQTVIQLFGEKIPIELTLSDRELMKNPILLGRKILQQRFIVDVDRKNVSFKKKKKIQ